MCGAFCRCAEPFYRCAEPFGASAEPFCPCAEASDGRQNHSTGARNDSAGPPSPPPARNHSAGRGTVLPGRRRPPPGRGTILPTRRIVLPRRKTVLQQSKLPFPACFGRNRLRRKLFRQPPKGTRAAARISTGGDPSAAHALLPQPATGRVASAHSRGPQANSPPFFPRKIRCARSRSPRAILPAARRDACADG